MGHLISETDALGIATRYNYDIMGRITGESQTAGTPENEEEPEAFGQTAYIYDTVGNLTGVTDAMGGCVSAEYNGNGQVTAYTDPTGVRTAYTYDEAGNLLTETDSLGGVAAYEYDGAGRIIRETDAEGRERTYTYDRAGRRTSMTDEDGTITYEYDEAGNLIRTADENGEILRSYDALGRVVKYTDYRGNEVTYGYDELGNLLTLTYPGGEIIRYEYYKNGLLKKVTDSDGAVTAYSYDGNGQLIKTERGDGSWETRTYDAAGQLLSITDTAADGTVINDLAYSYAADGTITAITGSKTTSTGNGQLNTVTMTYDEAGRLVSYNGEEVCYDACGNMIYGPAGGMMQNLEYDCRNRLVKVGETSYTYDCENNRIGMEACGVATEYMVETVSSQFSRVLYQTVTATASDSGEETGNVKVTVTTYVYGNGLVSQTTETETLYYHYNHLGSTIALTDAEGAVTAEYTYGTYGELLSGDTDKTAYLYNGQFGVSTDGNGLYYMRARYYSTDIKRFINRDVVKGDLTSSQSLNRYCYVQGNPVSYTDPFGLSPFKKISSAIHGVLDVIGMVPVIGTVADGLNALVYVVEGDLLNAALSVGAAVLVVDGVAKVAKGIKSGKVTQKLSKIKQTVKSFLKKGADDVQDGLRLAKGGKNTDELIHVYRGTDKYTEILAFDETGQLMSDATRNLYFETGNLNVAYRKSGVVHENWLKIWGNENEYVQAHGAFGTELSQAFGLDRTFMSVTTDPEVAQRFAGAGGRVFEAYIPKSQLIQQTLSDAGESEYLIKFGVGGFK